MPNPKLIGLFLIFIFQIGCGLSAPSENRRVASLELITVYPNAAPIATEIPIEEATVLKPQDFVGCWSSGSGNVIRITNNQIFYYVKKFKPVNYLVEKSEPNVLVLRLIERPQFYIFQEFISLEVDNKKTPHTGIPLITIRDYASLEDLNDQHQSGISGWTKGDCKEWFHK
jgi:hypothetical protein